MTPVERENGQEGCHPQPETCPVERRKPASRRNSTGHIIDQAKDTFTLVPFPHHGQDDAIQMNLAAVIGRGSGGTVLMALLVGKTVNERVAVKVLNAVPDCQTLRLIKREVDIWASLSHPRLLPYYGSCQFGLQQIGLVSPLMSNGNMVEFLRQKPSADRLKLVREVAEGLAYLHHTARIVHGDLKGENVLISSEESAKISDFELCTFVEYDGNVTATNVRSRYTLCFAAPELLMDEATSSGSGNSVIRSKTTYTDVYAYGMLVYQVYAGRRPWTFDNNMMIYTSVIRGHHPPRTVEGDARASFPDHIWRLCERCWSLDPLDRPKAGDILETISTFVIGGQGGVLCL